MNIDLDRLCKLAGVEASGELLSEASNRSMHDDPALDGEAEHRFGSNQLAEADAPEGPMEELYAEEEDPKEGLGHYEEGVMGYHEGADDDDDAREGAMRYEEDEPRMEETLEENLDEIIEVDEAMLVQEIRRARQLMAEAREQKTEASQEDLHEQQIRRIVEEEVDSLMKDLNLTAGWVYGSNKPQNTHKGKVHTGFPGIGFKNSK